MEQNNSMKMIVAALLVVILGVASFAVLSSGDDDDSDSSSTAATSQIDKSDDFPLDVDFTNLEPLSEGLYEGWIVRGDDKFSFGTFNTNEAGAVEGVFELDNVTPANGDKVVVTIEPVPDNNPDPSGTVILAGDIMNGSADLAFPVDVSGFSGKYILATPSNGDNTNETAGVWFLNPADMTASLNIPVAPDGWIYEGWVVHEGTTPISTGQFKDPAAADMFDGFTGDMPVPPFPGEDLIKDLPNGLEGPLEFDDGVSAVVISLEPYVDGTDPTGPSPAQVKPLSAVVPEGAKDHFLYDLSVSTESVPSGTASL